jgi:hypothetical protein
LYFETTAQQVWLAAMSIACGLAFWRGGREERIAAVACLAAWFVSPLVQDKQNWLDPQWGMMGVDTGLFLALTILAVTTTRIWPLFAAAFQLVAVVVHFGMIADSELRALAYLRGLVIFSYLVLVALAVGALTTPKRDRRPARADEGAPQ